MALVAEAEGACDASREFSEINRWMQNNAKHTQKLSELLKNQQAQESGLVLTDFKLDQTDLSALQVNDEFNLILVKFYTEIVQQQIDVSSEVARVLLKTRSMTSEQSDKIRQGLQRSGAMQLAGSRVSDAIRDLLCLEARRTQKSHLTGEKFSKWLQAFRSMTSAMDSEVAKVSQTGVSTAENQKVIEKFAQLLRAAESGLQSMFSITYATSEKFLVRMTLDEIKLRQAAVADLSEKAGKIPQQEVDRFVVQVGAARALTAVSDMFLRTLPSEAELATR